MTEPAHATIHAWLVYLDEQGKSRATRAAYRRGVNRFACWIEQSYGEAFDPAAVIPRDVRAWQSHQQTVERAAPSTINQRLVALSRYFQWALRHGLTRTNPVADVPFLRLPAHHPQSLDGHALRRLLRAVHREGYERDIAIIEVLAGTGVRVGELLDLTVGDVHLHPRSGTVVVRQGKHGSYREIPLARDVRAALQAYLAHHPQRNDAHAPLWLGERGPLRSRSAVARLLDKYTLRAGLPAVTPHQLRHTFATHYLAANPDDLRGLAALLGHADLNSVMRYTEPTVTNLIQRIERMAVAEVTDGSVPVHRSRRRG